MRWQQYILLLLLLPSLVMADTLWMKNGDRISGKMTAVLGDSLSWSSESFGELSIDLTNVKAVSSEERFDVDITDSPRLYGCRPFYEDSRQWLQCSQYTLTVLAFADIEEATAAAVDGPPQPVPTSYTGFIRLSAESSHGNKEELDVNVSAEESIRLVDTRHIISGEYRIETDDEEQTDKRQLLSYQYNKFLTPVWFLSANTSVSSDDFKDIESRYVAGVGFGYQFWETEFVELSMEAGINYLRETYHIAEEDRNRPAFRWATNYHWYLQGRDKGPDLFYKHEYFVSMLDSSDWEVSAYGGVSYPISDRLSAFVSLQLDYDGQPPATKEAGDRIWLLGVDYGW
ncbi:putative salt-induced outer membrane protein YdiY [Sinobacterium caligoides]|uniref:Putative salt-induced outer membrane protein YdiY n=1 Tax=Sinobacterium caligoides TaxID=933926 RepID=A0A3N2DNN7_9GAMM|nr:DUF481 domain-containing protein [Sinobacterium caligoides]ROS01279.1 putative salt-induced outer membrane protein YdiY [Sinobacterium caligoides]